MRAVDRIVDQLDAFPTLPDVAVEVLSRIDAPDVTLEEIADKLSLDQSLAARIIKLANSALFAASRPAESLRPAVFRLGTREVKLVVTAVAIMDALPPGLSADTVRAFWVQSLAAALVGRKLAADIGYPDPDEAYLAGLVHRIGEVLLAVQLPDRFNRALDEAKAIGLPRYVALTGEFGCDHAEIGAHLLSVWNFPIPILEAVRYQFTPARAGGGGLLAAIVCCADHIALDLGLGLPDPTYTPGAWIEKLPPLLTERLERCRGIDLRDYIEHARESLDGVAEFAPSIFG
jgi:HD-like signal output (HDOD) protein